MFKPLILLLLSTLLISCNENMVDDSPNPPVSGTDGLTSNEQLDDLITDFQSLYGVSINFTVALDNGNYTGSKNSSGTIIGVCRIYSSGKREVFLNQSWFLNASSYGQKVVTFHELGHCKFNRDHDSSVFSNGMPMSMMYPVINPILTYFDQNSSYYLGELYQNQQSMVSSSLTLESTYEMTDSGNCAEEHGHE